MNASKVEIDEVENKEISLKGFKCKNDGKINCEWPLSEIPYCAFLIVNGPCGSGKTNLILNLLTRRKKMYYKQFDKIYIFSPSLGTVSRNIHLPDDQIFPDLDFDELNAIIEKERNAEGKRILLVFDDVIASINKNQKEFLKLCYNRRHINATIILVSQVYNKIPLEIRKVCSALFFFTNTNKKEIQSVYDDLILVERPIFDAIIKHCFQGPHDFLFYIVDSQQFFHNFNQLIIHQ